MSAHILLNLFNSLRKRDKMRGRSMNVRFYLSYDIKITLKSHFCRKNIKIFNLSLHVRSVVIEVITFPENLQTTSGLSILLHGVISLPDATAYDKGR